MNLCVSLLESLLRNLGNTKTYLAAIVEKQTYTRKLIEGKYNTTFKECLSLHGDSYIPKSKQ